MTSPSDNVASLMKLAHTTFPSDAAHSPMVTSKSVCRTTVPNDGSGPFKNRHFTSQLDRIVFFFVFFFILKNQQCLLWSEGTANLSIFKNHRGRREMGDSSMPLKVVVVVGVGLMLDRLTHLGDRRN